MADFRFKNGVALGPVGNFQSRTDNLFTSLDTTPDVTYGNLFYTNNASATSITHFDLSGSNVTSERQGKAIKVLLLDGNTTLVNSSVLRLADAQDVTPAAGAVFDFLYVNSAWYETKRSYNTSNILAVDSTTFVSSVGDLTINPGIKQLIVTVQANSVFTLRRLLGGSLGQQVSIFAANSTAILAANSAGATGSFVTGSSAGAAYNVLGSQNALFTLVLQGSTAKWVESTDRS